MKPILLIFLFLLLLSSFCGADVIHLKDGEVIKGEVLAVDETEVEVLLPYGRLTVARTDVLRIDFGESQPEPQKEKPSKPERIEPEAEVVEPALSEEPFVEVAEPRGRKRPATAAAFAVLPGGGYAYLDRWDLAMAAAGIEIGLMGWGMSLAGEADEGNSSTGYVLLGFVALLKAAEIFDSYNRAVEWNRLLDADMDMQEGSIRFGIRTDLCTHP